MFFPYRSYQKELLDNDDIPFEDIKQNMQELNFINTWLGGHSITIAGLQKILCSEESKSKIYNVCEIGCGGGDNLIALDRWAKKKGYTLHLTGIDKKKECIDFAKEKIHDPAYQWIHSSYETADLGSIKPDIIFSSLFCHHFTDEELILMMRWMQNNSTKGFFINDLHRHFLAFFSIKGLTKLFSKSYLVKHDAPLSVARGFTKKDWVRIMQQSGIQHYSIEWKWAFRWLITVK
ncbi:MAG: methyltransferase domain-containing protein [Terrimonas sp.]|nr:methyltransferase domain-containing protein [Terrimonas sp.]OJY93568.1 MAG: SAM-dependent methyltransferase [Sphingobacteriales bacterium 40-81]